MATDVPSVEEIMRRVTRLFTGVNSEPSIPRLFGADYSPNPGDVERLRSDPPEPVFEEPTQDPPAARDAGDAAADPPRLQRVATRKRRAAAAATTPSSHQATGTDENPEPPRQGVVDVTGERSLASGRSPPVTSPPFSTHSGNKTAPRGLVVPMALPLKKPARKSETPKPASSSIGQMDTSADSVPKDPAAASAAETPIVEDVPAGTGGKDLEPPVNTEAEPETEASESSPRANLGDGGRIVQQAIASTPDQQGVLGSSRAQDAPESSPGRQQEEILEDSRLPKQQEEEIPPPRAELFEDPLGEPETVTLMMELGRRFTNYTKSLVECSREKSALLNRIGDVLPRTHDAEDKLEAEKAKNLKLQEELEALKTSHRDAMIDQQWKHDLAIWKVKDLTA